MQSRFEEFLKRPLLLAEIAPEQFNLIDGPHRAEKARRVGARKLLAYKVPPEVHVAFLTSKKAYLACIEYWNGKLKERQGDMRLNSR